MRQDRKNPLPVSDLGARLGLRPLTARSVLLSVLLGTVPPRLPVARLVRAANLFGISDGAARTALSRLAATDELVAEDGWYGLSPRHGRRQARQEHSRHDPRLAWDGTWWIEVVVAERRTAPERADLRVAMATRRFAEQREGVWVRPANLAPAASPAAEEDLARTWCRRWRGTAEGAGVGLPAELWPLVAWAERAEALRRAFVVQTSLAEGFVVAAAALHHFLADPLLPDELLPADWPGEALRVDYDRFWSAYRRQLRDFLRDT